MKRIPVILFIVIGAVLIGGCRTARVNVVRIPVTTENAIGFADYKTVLYEKIDIQGFQGGYDPEPVIDYFFLNELPKTVRKTVGRYRAEEIAPSGFKEGEALLIGGKIELNVKERNVIEESGKKKLRVFKKIENWELVFTIFFRDMTTGKEVFSKVFKESLNGADRSKPDYNFEFIFRKITERFVRLFLGLGRLESRYLLK